MNELLRLLQKSQAPAGGGLLMPQTRPTNALAGLLGTGLAPHGFRHEEIVSAPFSAKGSGYFGPLPHSGGGVSTEISAHDDTGRGFPLMVPTLTSQELAALLRDRPTEDVYQKAMAYAEMLRRAGRSPFQPPIGLRAPLPR